MKGYGADKMNTIVFIDTLENESNKQIIHEWEILFDGRNVSKWTSARSDKFPSEGWEVENETLFANRKGGGDIITREKYSDFELVLDFKLTDTANSLLVQLQRNPHYGDFLQLDLLMQRIVIAHCFLTN
jgi:hypothetical protein